MLVRTLTLAAVASVAAASALPDTNEYTPFRPLADIIARDPTGVLKRQAGQCTTSIINNAACPDGGCAPRGSTCCPDGINYCDAGYLCTATRCCKGITCVGGGSAGVAGEGSSSGTGTGTGTGSDTGSGTGFGAGSDFGSSADTGGIAGVMTAAGSTAGAATAVFTPASYSGFTMAGGSPSVSYGINIGGAMSSAMADYNSAAKSAGIPTVNSVDVSKAINGGVPTAGAGVPMSGAGAVRPVAAVVAAAAFGVALVAL